MSVDTPLDPDVLDKLRQLTAPDEPDVLHQVLQLFLSEVPRRIEKLRNALSAGDIEEVGRSAHSLKGSAGNIGARALHEVCSQLDARARANDLAGARPLVDEVGVEFDKVESEIHRLIGA